MAGVAMMLGLTHQQAVLLAYLRKYSAERGGVAPSYDEMMVELECSSKSNISRLLIALEDRGFIKRQPNKTRAIRLLREDLSHISTGDLIAELDRRSALPAYVDTHEGFSA